MKRTIATALTVLTLAGVGLAVQLPNDDVARCGRCGDGFCNPSCGENEITCPADCGATTK